MPEAAGGKNAYFCQTCQKYIVTVNIVEGVTPMFLSCRAAEGCEGRMTSCMYPPHPWPEEDGFGNKIPKEVTHEWYMPDEIEMKRLRKKARHGDLNAASELDHYERGGLALRKVASA